MEPGIRKKVDLFDSLGPRVAKRASDVLSVMTGNKITVSLDDVNVVETSKIPDMIGDEEGLSLGSYVRIRGDLKGVALFLLPVDKARTFVDLLQKKDVGHTKIFGELDRSAINETCNILSGAYLTELGDAFGLNLYQSVPVFTSNSKIKTTKSIVASFNLKNPTAVSLQTRFVIAAEETKGLFILFFDSNSLEKVKVD